MPRFNPATHLPHWVTDNQRYRFRRRMLDTPVGRRMRLDNVVYHDEPQRVTLRFRWFPRTAWLGEEIILPEITTVADRHITEIADEEADHHIAVHYAGRYPIPVRFVFVNNSRYVQEGWYYINEEVLPESGVRAWHGPIAAEIVSAMIGHPYSRDGIVRCSTSFSAPHEGITEQFFWGGPVSPVTA